VVSSTITSGPVPPQGGTRVADYRFVTTWRLRAPIAAVFALIDDVDTWPAWWPNVRSVERITGADPDGLGGKVRITFVGRLPYRLRFDMEVTRHDPPSSLVGVATGELAGVGEWTLSEDGDWTVVRYVWAIRTTRAWMNALAPVPFVDAIFRLNHHAVMRSGLTAIRRRLGGVEGSYTRVE
jgi:carbon monoxide dehydrogenase subunit G